MAEESANFIEVLKKYGIGKRKINDELFMKEKSPPKFCVYDSVDETLCKDM